MLARWARCTGMGGHRGARGEYPAITLMSWEGRPTAYQLVRTDVLRDELVKISGAFDALLKNDLVRINGVLTERGLPRIEVPETVNSEEVTLPGATAQAAVRAAFALH